MTSTSAVIIYIITRILQADALGLKELIGPGYRQGENGGISLCPTEWSNSGEIGEKCLSHAFLFRRR